jgi:hypothetical protein
MVQVQVKQGFCSLWDGFAATSGRCFNKLRCLALGCRVRDPPARRSKESLPSSRCVPAVVVSPLRHQVYRHPRSPPPLIVSHHTSAPTEDNGALFDILDLSGRVLKQVPMAVGEEHKLARSTQLGFVLFHGGASLRLLDPTTGTTHALPDGLAEEHELHGLSISDYSVVVAATRIRATGELKVLRVLSSYPRHYGPQLCEICSVVGDGSHPRWRGINAPPREIGIGHWHGAVISAIAYFLYEWHDEDAGPDRIISFDLETEEWRPALVGPLTSLLNDNADDDYDHDTYFEWYDYTLASLSGRLVFVHDTNALYGSVGSDRR